MSPLTDARESPRSPERRSPRSMWIGGEGRRYTRSLWGVYLQFLRVYVREAGHPRCPRAWDSISPGAGWRRRQSGADERWSSIRVSGRRIQPRQARHEVGEPLALHQDVVPHAGHELLGGAGTQGIDDRLVFVE